MLPKCCHKQRLIPSHTDLKSKKLFRKDVEKKDPVLKLLRPVDVRNMCLYFVKISHYISGQENSL